MIAVDASALIAILKKEPEEDAFARLMADDECVISAVSLMEASFVLAGRLKSLSAWTQLDLILAVPHIEVVAFDETLARFAREAFLRYGKGRDPAALNLGDCASYALAESRGLPAAVQGRGFCADGYPRGCLTPLKCSHRSRLWY